MENNEPSTYSIVIRERLKLIMEISGLEVAGFSEFTKVSVSHIYAILNGRKSLTAQTANKIAIGFKLNGWNILNLDFKITEAIKSSALNKFYADHKEAHDYFKETVSERKDSYFFEHELIPTGIFDKPVYIWEVREACIALGRNLSSKQIAHIAEYLAVKNKLDSEKRPIKKKNGEFGERMITVYYLEKNKKRAG